MRKSLDPKRLGGIILALTLLLGLAGCTALRLGYEKLPGLAYWWLDGYADFHDAQTPQVRTELARLHAWHREQELPRLADLLGRIEQMAPGEITPQQACTVVTEVQERLAAVADRAEPAAAAIAGTLGERQLQRIARKFRSKNDTFQRENIEPDANDRLDDRYEQMLERAETLYGRLDARQRALLREALAQSAYDPARILADRQRRQQDLLQTLRRMARPDTPADDDRAQLRAWLERARHAPDPAYRAWQEGLVQEGCRIFAAVHQSTTGTQREQAVRRLRAYQRDLRELAAASR
jgi:hypothetical protein